MYFDVEVLTGSGDRHEADGEICQDRVGSLNSRSMVENDTTMG
jgi:hypothetical protein